MTFSINPAPGAPLVYGAKKIDVRPVKLSDATEKNSISAPAEGLTFTEWLALIVFAPLACGRSPMDDPQGQAQGNIQKPKKDAGAPAFVPTPDASVNATAQDALPASSPDAFISPDSVLSADQIVFGAPDAQSDLAGRPDLIGQPDLLGRPDLIGQPDLAGPDSFQFPDAMIDTRPADPCAPANGILTAIFRDKNLLAGLRVALGKGANEDITVSDAQTLATLALEQNNISDVHGLECFTGLRHLDLGFNNVSDLTPLSGLTGLDYLNLNANSDLADLSPLAGMRKLTTLWLMEDNISDLFPLAQLTELSNLGLSFNQISDLSALAKLTKLVGLILSYNQITDLSPLTGLTNLTDLQLRAPNNISDITPLINNVGLGQGDKVDLQGNPIPSSQLDALSAKGVIVSFR